MDVYLLPDRRGDYFLHAGELDPLPERQTSESDSAAQKILTLAQKGYDRLTWSRRQREILLKELGNVERVRILYPSSLSEKRARQLYDELIQKEIAKHKKWMVVNTAALPVSVPLSLIPGPNVLLFYLAWRSVSHYKTKKAGEKAAGIAIEFVPDSLLAELARLVRQWPFRARRRIRALGEKLGLARLDWAY